MASEMMSWHLDTALNSMSRSGGLNNDDAFRLGCVELVAASILVVLFLDPFDGIQTIKKSYFLRSFVHFESILIY